MLQRIQTFSFGLQKCLQKAPTMYFPQQSPVKLSKYIYNAYLLSANTTTTKEFTNMTYVHCKFGR